MQVKKKQSLRYWKFWFEDPRTRRSGDQTPGIGTYSLDLYVVLGRPGFSIADKKCRAGCIVVKHRISKEEALHWSHGIILPGK